MKKLLALLLLTASTTAAPKSGQLYQTVQADLNGDGKPEKIGLVAYGHSPEGFYGRLKVWDSGGKLLWQAPTVQSSDAPFAFGNWEYGSSTIEWVSPSELISAKPQSDVRPTTFKRFRWTGSAYQPAGNGYLLQDGTGAFAWTQPFEWDGVKPLTWVVSLVKNREGNVMSVQGGDRYLGGTADLQPTPQGFKVSRWLKRLSSH
ncbi:MAG: hypothetical protein KF760_23320 [Candidatus Eremiobacteraeota bacterium]|nr:hypothetical protein [Candidatus Eremiobacteraeota bacterium]MCW5866155.1 hypothetical protein [Candidatus Eremiobacteraeota bacterium]